MGRKQAIEQTEMFDFLREIVQSVSDPTNGGLISEQELAEQREGTKKRKRKAKAEDLGE